MTGSAAVQSIQRLTRCGKVRCFRAVGARNAGYGVIYDGWRGEQSLRRAPTSARLRAIRYAGMTEVTVREREQQPGGSARTRRATTSRCKVPITSPRMRKRTRAHHIHLHPCRGTVHTPGVHLPYMSTASCKPRLSARVLSTALQTAARGTTILACLLAFDDAVVPTVSTMSCPVPALHPALHGRGRLK